MTELSYLLAIASSITYGTADFLGGLATKRSTELPVIVVSQSVGLVLVLIALPFLPAASPTAIDFAWGGASGLAGGLGLALLYRGLARGVMSVVAPVTAVCAVVIPLAVGLALGERPSGQASLGILVAIAAIVLISQTGQATPGGSVTTGFPIAIASGIFIGFFLVCLERTGPTAGLWPLVAARLVSISLFAIAGLLMRRNLVPPRSAMAIVVASGALDMVANILYLLAVQRGALSIVATLTSLYPASTILLARITLGERLRFVQVVGVGCAALAIVLIVSA